MKTKIMLVDDDEEIVHGLKEFFDNSERHEVVGVALDGERALELLPIAAPDVLILDLVMPKADGFSVLERMTKGGLKIIVLSALSQDAFVSKAVSLGADYYMKKPVSFEILMERIDELISPKAALPKAVAKPKRNNSLEEMLANIFITVGIPGHIQGYKFLRESIKIVIDSPDIINMLTKRLYPNVAARFSTTPSKVERAIRHAIEVAWNKGKIENINALFGVKVYNSYEKPTNGEFIALIADKLLLSTKL